MFEVLVYSPVGRDPGREETRDGTTPGNRDQRIARWNIRSVERLVRDAGIVRHRGKIESVLNNARCVCDLVEERGSLADYVWSFQPMAKERPRTLTLAALRKLTGIPEPQQSRLY